MEEMMNKILITVDPLKAQYFLKTNFYGLGLVILPPLFKGVFVCLNSAWLKKALEDLAGCRVISELDQKDSVRIWGERLSHPAELYFPEGNLKSVMAKIRLVLPDSIIVKCRIPDFRARHHKP